MSEIFAPGSAAAGPQGPAGAAGSASAVSALAGAIAPSFVGRNLYDPALSIADALVNASNGTLTIGGGQPTNASPLMYCPGATSMVSNGLVAAGVFGGGICLYDANGNFISASDSGSGGQFSGAGYSVGQAFVLPGTQTYVRWGHIPSYDNVAETAMMCFATITGTATLPSSYQAAGLETVANAAANLTAALTAVPAELIGLALPGSLGVNTRNMFDPNKVLLNTQVNGDGTLSAASGLSTAVVYAPGSTSFIANIPFFAGAYNAICTYDAFGNFLADIYGTVDSYNNSNGRSTANTLIPLPGNQTYLRFSWATGEVNTGNSGQSGGYANSLESALFFSGTTAAPPPTTLTGLGFPKFAGNTSPYARTATSLGATPDGTDSTAMLNAFLALASSSNPLKLILDGMFSCYESLVISANGYTTIEGLGAGTGIIVNGPNDGIRIGAYVAGTGDSEGNGTTAPSRMAAYITLRDFTVNASAQTNAAANQPVTGAAGHGTYPIILANCSNVICDGLNFPTAGANYCITLSNVDHVRVANSVFTTSGYVHDGVHIDGPSSDIGIMNCDFATGDDAIALNAPEGWGGDISRVTITNCRFNGSLSVMRIYTSFTGDGATSGPFKVRDVVVSNCTGVVANIAFVLGISGGGEVPTAGVDQIQDLSISNCTFSAPTNLIQVRDYIGAISLRGVRFIPTSTNAVFDLAYGIGELSLDDFTILRNPDGNAAPVVVSIESGSAIDKLSLLHCRVVDEEGSSYTVIPCWVDAQGTVAALRLEAVDLTHVTALMSSEAFANVSLVRGGGVLGTGTQIPDSVMDNNALYLSSTDSGALSMKVGGTAKRLALA